MSIQFEGEYIDEGALRPNPNSSAVFQKHARSHKIQQLTL